MDELDLVDGADAVGSGQPPAEGVKACFRLLLTLLPPVKPIVYVQYQADRIYLE